MDHLIDKPMQWIDWFLEIPGNQFLVQVDISFLYNSTNMFEFKDKEQFGLQYYEEAHSMILGLAPRTSEELDDPKFQLIYQQAVDLYGLIHHRYI